MEKLILKRASDNRPSGEWNDDDYDVLNDGKVVGRIMKAAASPVGAPWMWTLAYGYHEGRSKHSTHAASVRERRPRLVKVSASRGLYCSQLQ